MQITVSKVNEVYLKIHAEPGILKELSEYFTFYVPGFQFTPDYKKKTWDGKIRLFDMRSNRIYYGLLHHIRKFSDDRNYELVLSSEDIDTVEYYPEYHADKFIQSLQLQSLGKDIEVRDFQKKSFIDAIRKKRILLLSPTASGKSLIIYLVVRQLLQYRSKKGLLIVPTTSLVEQLYKDFEDYSTKNGWSVEKNVHRVYEGRTRHTHLPLTISTWQSMYKMEPAFFHQFDFIIGDEAHLFKAKSLVSIMTNCINAKYRMGTTGTLDGTKTHKLVLEGLFGGVQQATTTRAMIKNKHSADLDIKCLILSYSEGTRSSMYKKPYEEEMDFLVSNERRNKFIRNLAISLKGNSLLLYQFVDKHGKILYNMIKSSDKFKDRKIFFVFGGTPTDMREQVRSIVENETNAIIIASYGTFSTGINIRNLHNIVFTSPSKSRIRNLQSIGRSLRLGSNKTNAVLYDIADDLRHQNFVNHTLKHFAERTKIYNEEQFNYKIYKIGINDGIN